MNEIPRAFCIIPALFKTISELIYHITGDNELISKQFNGQLVLQTKLLWRRNEYSRALDAHVKLNF